MAANPKTGSEEFGDLLRRGRERLGMSRRDLVEATGLSYPYISQLETGYRQPSPAAIQKLADALQLSLDDLFQAMAKGRRDEMSVGQERESPSRWVRNAGFSGAGAVAAGSPAPAARPAALSAGSAAQPRGHAATHPEPAPVRLEHYAQAPAPQDFDADAVVDQVLDLMMALPASLRMETLARAQAEIVQSVIDDGIRGGRES
jgi:DNA-binding XRE family transcriptional regulator